ncbi:MAG: NAD(P)/FAD-dependent oxidoreductase [Acidobacteriota bacterium]|nr:NAD(P)/FAD-dependent oxidoreductase [Acidobacteriota bacterium]
MSTDVFVIGGGPAGLAAAIAARANGFRVILADPARPPIDKACGEGLMPDSLAALRGLGVALPLASESFPFRGIRLHGAGAAVDASFPNGSALGVRRTVLHPLLVERAEQAGVELLWRTRVNGIAGSMVDVDGRQVRATWIVGADGQNSRVRQWAGLDRHHNKSERFGFRRHYRVAPWTDCMEIYWGAGCQIYTTPVGPAEVCVALISRDSHLRLDETLASFPNLSVHLEGAAATTAEKGAITVTRRLKGIAAGNVALIGDASGSVDAITGEGLCLSFLQAVSLAGALAAGRLQGYQSAHNRLMRRPAMMGDMMLLLDRWPSLLKRVLPALAARPSIFYNMLAMHVGNLKPREFFFDAIVPLGWGILQS